MQSESISQEKRTTKTRLRNAANSALTEVFVEQEFFLDPFSLRAQSDWKVARRSIDQAERETDAGLSTVSV
jgi:hypothetical protein